MAVTRQPASTASTSSASESAPPDTAQSTRVPGSGNVQRGSSWLADTRDPRFGLADLGDGGKQLRSFPHAVEQRLASGVLDRGDELLALLVLVQFEIGRASCRERG